MQELTVKQHNIGSAIQNLLSNIKKDPKGRKTEQYAIDRLQRADELWKTFCTQHNEIVQLHDVDKEHDYFKKKYFQAIEKCHERLLTTLDIIREDANSAAKSNPLEESSVLNNQRALIKAITRIIKDIEAHAGTSHPSTYYDLKAQLLEKYQQQLAVNNSALVTSEASPENNDYSPETFYDMDCWIQNTLISLREHCVQPLPHNHAAELQQFSPVQLPKITLPVFDGNYLKWVQFRDMYIQLIHQQPINDVQKMFYLSTNLVGEPKNLIKHLSASGENYDIAWNILMDRYNNKRVLVTSLLNKLLAQQNIVAESAAALKSLHDTTKECILGLKAQGLPTDAWDALIVHILIKKLDRTTHTALEQSEQFKSQELHTLKSVLHFLESRFRSLEALSKPTSRNESSNHRRNVLTLTTSRITNQCIACKLNHPLFACSAFKEKSLSQKYDLLKQNKVCTNCLKSGHVAAKCSSRGCSKCQRKHNTLLHRDNLHQIDSARTSSPGTAKESSSNTPNQNGKPALPIALSASTKSQRKGYILLGTAVIHIIASNGRTIKCRALLDSGSQINVVTKDLVSKLGLSTKSTCLAISGIGGQRQNAQHRVHMTFQSLASGFKTSMEAYVLPKIISMQPSQTLDIAKWPIPQNIKLADPDFHLQTPIDVLLGAEFYNQLMSVGQIKLSDDLPTLQNTVLGWIISGKVENIDQNNITCGIFSTEDETLNDTVSKFWELEDVNETVQHQTEAEKLCEAHFHHHTSRSNDGQFVVKLPFTEDPSVLGESKEIARNRFLALERRLSKDQNLKNQYVQFMQEYQALGHMKEISEDDILAPQYFIPHHAVMKPDSTTTKLRVVFDASCKTSTGLSLNDIIHNGPTVQSDLFSILLRFRLHRYVFTTDIEKMYRQILMHPEDQRLHLIFWRTSPDECLRIYQLCTVTYGTRSAPYLATKCLTALADENDTAYPLGAKALRKDFYVDDGVSGADSLAEVIMIKEELKKILHQAGFKPRKWCSNSSRLLKGVAVEDQEVNMDLGSNINESTKTLGLIWLPKSDVFYIKTNVNMTSRVTKRTITSDTARIFDPLGIMAPVVVTAKIFIQRLWQLKLDWDEAVPLEIHTRWITFRNSLHELKNANIARHMYNHQQPKDIELHAFSDASERAYGAVIYVRATLRNGIIIARLLCAKSRVAPLKFQTIPRLELCAALLATQLMARVKQDLNYQDRKTFYWTDSQIVLSWINTCSSSFQTFVAHRVAKIQRLSLAEQWRHVSTKHNPADVLSRGLLPSDIMSCNLWFYGPIFLHQKDSSWLQPIQRELLVNDTTEYKKSLKNNVTAIRAEEVAVAVNTTDKSVVYTIKFTNSFRSIQRVVGYMLRFISRIQRNSAPYETKQLTPSELEDALRVIVKEIQAADFPEELKRLQNRNEIPRSNDLSCLSPFLDKQGIIRVGGRLEASSLPYDSRHPMLLPYNDSLTKMLIEAIHIENLHCGPQALLAKTRQRFWPIKGKIMARSVVKRCVRCTKAKPVLYKQIMGPLPSSRIEPARPFINSGVDYCGPLWIHFKTRGKRPQKAYLAVFCCFTTKAVHFEVVSELTTDAFIGALKRFIGRRGHCKNLYCDNATNFVGAKRKLEDLEAIYSKRSQDSIRQVCSLKGICFHFIPPRAPHFGGLWEAAVKSAKHLLLRNTATASLTYEELETIVIEIEAILNSRPITPMSADPNDLSALTPGHFLIGEPLTSTVDVKTEYTSRSLITRWELVSKIKHDFWKQWSSEYLNELQFKYKWKGPVIKINPDTLVILKDDNLPVQQWPLGRITKTYEGKDGVIRVVDVKTKMGIKKRPIHGLAPLFPEEMREEADGTSTQNSTNEETPRKQRKLSTGLSLISILALALLLPLVLSNPIKTTSLDSNVGLYFENIGTTRLVPSFWNIVVFYNMTAFHSQVSSIVNGTGRLQELCNRMKHTHSCQLIIDQFEEFTREIKIEDMFAMNRRHKRGAIDIVGNIANSLFGVLDSKYADTMSKTVTEIYRNEDILHALLKNQTSVVDSTINILKKDETAIKGKFDELDQQILLILDKISNHNYDWQQIEMFQLFTSLSFQIILCISNFQNMKEALLDVITDTHHDKINPLLLTPIQLKQELASIRDHLPPSVQLPIQPEDFLMLYRLITVTGTLTTDHIIFNLKMPLVDQQRFDLFKVNPVPRIVNNSIMTIKPDTPILALSPHRKEYFPITTKQLSSCMTLQTNAFLCQNTQLIYSSGSGVCDCEITSFNNESAPNCKWTTVKGSMSFIPTYYKNQWTYATTQPIRMNVVCGTKGFVTTITGSGLLQMQSTCSMKNNAISIQGHQDIDSAQLYYDQNFIIAVNDSIINNNNNNSYNSSQFTTNIAELTALHKVVSSQNNQMLSFNMAHHYAVSYTSLVLCITIILLYVIVKYCKCKVAERPRTPQPLSRHSQSQPNFCVIVDDN